ncbi:hypothetical protein CPB86DRAFT_812085 [Serendipita vermifera]|nr:hypothetical protein CPB86DRAFT_812085 [Serendipita vermifera]
MEKFRKTIPPNLSLSLDISELCLDCIIDHEILDRTKKLSVRCSSTKRDGRLPPSIRLPNILSCRIKAPTSFLQPLVFQKLESLQFINSYALRATLDLGLIPSTLTELALKKVTIIGQGDDASTQPRCFPNLTTLKISYSGIRGLLRHHLVLPKLKNLYLKQIQQWSGTVRRKFCLSNEPFLHESSQFELLSLQRVTLDDNLAQVLPQCSRLHYLKISHCNTDDFLPSFVTNLTYGGAFPALQILHIKNSWTTEQSLGFIGLVELCVRTRPAVEVSGNGEYFEDEERNWNPRETLAAYQPRPVGEELSDDSMTLLP